MYLDWKLQGNRAIRALVTRGKGHNIGLEIRDPEKGGKRIGPPSDRMCDEDDNDDDESHDEEERTRRWGAIATVICDNR